MGTRASRRRGLSRTSSALVPAKTGLLGLEAGPPSVAI